MKAPLSGSGEGPSRVSLAQAWDREYWMSSLGVEEADLREAVRFVGDDPLAVEEYLHRKMDSHGSPS